MTYRAFNQFIRTYKNELSTLTAGAMPIIAVLWQGASTESELEKKIRAVNTDLSKKIDGVEERLMERLMGVGERLMKEIHHAHAVAIGSTLIPITDPNKKLAILEKIRQLDQCLRSGGVDYFRGKYSCT